MYKKVLQNLHKIFVSFLKVSIDKQQQVCYNIIREKEKTVTDLRKRPKGPGVGSPELFITYSSLRIHTVCASRCRVLLMCRQYR